MEVLKTIRQVFADNLRSLRGNRTQEQMAEALGLPYTSYQKLESGQIPQRENLAELARALGVSETSLFQDSSLLPPEMPEFLEAVSLLVSAAGNADAWRSAIDTLRAIDQGRASRLKPQK